MKRLFSNSVTIIILVFILFFVFVFLKTSFTLSKITTDNSGSADLPVYLLPELDELPKEDSNLFNFLLLGQRGEGKPFGGLLTDAIMLISFNRTTNKVALISLPRDLYVPLPESHKRDKLNAVYAWGYEKRGVGLGLAYIKDTVSRISGLYVDNAAVVNFDAFEQLIDAIGGIEIYLDKDFVEDKQWWCDKEGSNCQAFVLPAGNNVLDGETALFYVRSRFSSSDFDRARRQQEVLLAIKKKILSLGFLANPLNVIRLVDLLGDNVRTDMGLNKLKEMVSYLEGHPIASDNFKSFVFNNGPDGFLYSRYINGRYILLPRTGNFTKIREKCLELSR